MESVKSIDSPRSSESIELDIDSDRPLLDRLTSEDLITFNTRTGHHRLIPQSASNFFRSFDGFYRSMSDTRDAPTTSAYSSEHTCFMPTRRPKDKPTRQPEPATEPPGTLPTEQSHEPMVDLRQTQTNAVYTVPLRPLTAEVLKSICRVVIRPQKIEQILYWNPIFKCWTEAIASGTLKLMKADVENVREVQVFILIKEGPELGVPETAADLPFMKEDGENRFRVVPVKRRREGLDPSSQLSNEVKETVQDSSLEISNPLDG